MVKSTQKPAPDVQTGAPRKPLTEQREAPLRSNVRAEISGEELQKRIAEVAYFRAQQRGFAPGYEQKDWMEAEAEVKMRLGLQPPAP